MNDEKFKIRSFFRDAGGIKTINEVPDILEMYNECFPGSKKTKSSSIRDSSNTNSMYLIDSQGKPLAYLELVDRSYVSDDKREYRAVEMYGVCVLKSERDKGYTYPFIKNSINILRDHLNLSDHTILGLHLAQRDRCMPVAKAFYDSLKYGEHVAFCTGGPRDLNPAEFFRANERTPMATFVENISEKAKQARTLNPRHPLYICTYRELGTKASWENNWSLDQSNIDEGKMIQETVRNVLGVRKPINIDEC